MDNSIKEMRAKDLSSQQMLGNIFVTESIVKLCENSCFLLVFTSF